MLLRIQMIRIHMLELRGRTALAMAGKDPRSRRSSSARRKIDARRLERRRTKMGPGPCALPPGRHRRLRGRRGPLRSGSSLLAAEHYDQAEMPLRAQILRYRLGEIQSDARHARAPRQRAEQWIKAQGIVSPARWAGMYAPGFAKISTESIETSY